MVRCMCLDNSAVQVYVHEVNTSIAPPGSLVSRPDPLAQSQLCNDKLVESIGAGRETTGSYSLAVMWCAYWRRLVRGTTLTCSACTIVLAETIHRNIHYSTYATQLRPLLAKNCIAATSSQKSLAKNFISLSVWQLTAAFFNGCSLLTHTL